MKMLTIGKLHIGFNLRIHINNSSQCRSSEELISVWSCVMCRSLLPSTDRQISLIVYVLYTISYRVRTWYENVSCTYTISYRYVHDTCTYMIRVRTWYICTWYVYAHNACMYTVSLNLSCMYMYTIAYSVHARYPLNLPCTYTISLDLSCTYTITYHNTCTCIHLKSRRCFLEDHRIACVIKLWLRDLYFCVLFIIFYIAAGWWMHPSPINNTTGLKAFYSGRGNCYYSLPLKLWSSAEVDNQ